MSYGKSLALSQNAFVQPPDQHDESREASEEPSLKRQKRQANVYDAVAGRSNSFDSSTGLYIDMQQVG